MLRALLTFGLLALALPAVAQEKLAKVEIGKRGKAATAFVDVPKGGTGTAFCIHPSGLFVTNAHVVHTAGTDDVILVLNPSLEGERILKAKVVRLDATHDLALLRVDGVKDLPSLALGSIKDVAELSEVVACGFPLGFALSPSVRRPTDKKTYPAISVNAGAVTALRHIDKELVSLQIDVTLTFGNSGGPVLDETGRVIGVVVRGLMGVGKGISSAIPVSHLETFLIKPDIAFAVPVLAREALGKPMEFKAGVVSFVPKAPEATLKLVLQAGDGAPREFPMEKKAGAWVVTATPHTKSGAARVELTIQLGAASVTGTVEDVVFTVGGKPVKLSGVRKIEFKEKPGVLLADGRTMLEGAIAGLGTLELDLAGQKVKLDLAKATKLSAQTAPEVDSVMATVIASVEGKEVARNEARIMIRDTAGPVAVVDPNAVKISPPALNEDKVIKRLPGTFSDVVLGGAGRYLIFHIPKMKKLAIFDVNEARVTKYIPLTEDDIAFAAGLDSIVIGLKTSGKLERWSLTTFEREKTFAPPFSEAITSVALGHASNGPVLVNGQFLELDTFKYSALVDDKGKDRPSIGAVLIGSGRFGSGRIPSADGSVFSSWNTHHSPSSTTTFVIEGGVVKRHEGGEFHHVIPGPDGRTVFTAKGIVSQTLQRADADDVKYGYCLPAVRGDYFLSLTTSDERTGAGGGFAVYFGNIRQPIAKLDKAGHGLRFDGWDRDAFGPWKRAFLIPDAKVIAVLPASNDQIVLHKFDAEEALEKSGEDYLLVTSRPARQAKAGAAFNYAVKVKSKQAGVTYKLESGPKGMVVSAEGVVTWAVPADATGDQDVILTVRDKAGTEVFHTFTLTVAK